MKNNLSRYSTNLAVSLLGRLIKAKIEVSGLENLRRGPTLFVINHFTRAETFLVPHAIHSYAGEYVRTLADDALFVGRFGDYLERLGVMSTREEGRDRKIIGDLMTGRQNWAIYPEGGMVKTKRLLRRGRLSLARPAGIGAPRTGAATLALKAEIYKRRYRRAAARGDAAYTGGLERRFGFGAPEELSDRETLIVPVTITYYPLRPGDNAIKSVVERFFKSIPDRLAEELEVEGNILLSRSDIDIRFGEPIRLCGFITRRFFFSRWIPPFLRSLERNNLLLGHEAGRLTRRFMRRIHEGLAVNIDHLFCAAFRHLGRSRIARDDLHRALYLAARQLARGGEHRLHATLGDDLVEFLAPVPHGPAESIVALAEKRGIVTRAGGEYRINKLQFEMMHMFHTIRLKNPLVVIANELEPLKGVTRVIADCVNAKPARLREETAAQLAQEDLERYAERYRTTYEEGVSLDRGSGAPFFRPVRGSKTGIVLAHGFLSRPEEVRPLAEALGGLGHSIYAVRLEGHGTTPEDLAGVRWRDWYRSFLRGYEALRCTGARVHLAGFSTGGVVALLAAGLWGRVDGVVSIGAPHDLGDIRARLLPAVNFWNELLDRLRFERGRYDFVENHPENPDINYRRIPVRALRQLDRLMDRCREALPRIEAPVLLMHGDNDPGVNVKSAEKFLHAIGSPDKELALIESDRHVVVRGEHLRTIAENIDRFIRNAPVSGRVRHDRAEAGKLSHS